MQTKLRKNAQVGWRRVLWRGATLGIGLTYGYTILTALYATLRTSENLWWHTPPEVGRLATITANALSIVLAAVMTGTLLAVVIAVIGASIALLVYWLLRWINPARRMDRALLIGATVAILGALLEQFALRAALGRPLLSLGVETYLFWFGVPGLIQSGAAAAYAWRLNHLLSPTPLPQGSKSSAMFANP